MANTHQAPRKPIALSKIIYLFLGGLLVLEIVLRLLAGFSPSFKAWIGNKPDSALILSLSGSPTPVAIQKDEAGYRNALKPAEANIVALGDETVYGNGVESSHLWINLLGQSAGQTVYNMGVPESGPLDYFLLAGQALELTPKQLIVAIHLQDDFYDSFVKGYQDSQFAEWRTADPERVEAIRKLQEKQPSEAGAAVNPPKKQKRKKTLLLIEFSKRLLGVPAKTVSVSPDSAKDEDLRPDYEKINREDARIAEGLNLTLAMIAKTAETARSAKAEPLILLVPSKFSILESATAPDPSNQDGQKILEQEGFTREKIRDFLKVSRVPFIDLYLPFLDAVQEGKNLLDADLNWSKEAHQLIALEAAAWLKERDFRVEHDKASAVDAKNEMKQEKSRGIERKMFFGFILILGLLTVVLTKVSDKGRPLFFAAFYGLIVLYQIWNPTDFFPFSSTAFMNTPKQRPVIYRKVTTVLQDGSKLNLPLSQIIPSLGGHRTSFLVRKVIRNRSLADSLATSIALAYEKKLGDMNSPRIREVRFEEWKWDFAHDPFDPDKGFALKRVIGKPAHEVSHA